MIEYTVRATCDYCGTFQELGGFSVALMAQGYEWMRDQSGWVIPKDVGDPVVCPACKVRASLTVLKGGR